MRSFFCFFVWLRPASPLTASWPPSMTNPCWTAMSEDAVRVEALMQGRAVTDISQADFRAAMDRLIDRTLIRQQMTNGQVPPVPQVESRLAQVRASFPEAKSDAAWQDILAAYGVRERQLRKSVEEQVQLMQFVERALAPYGSRFGRGSGKLLQREVVAGVEREGSGSRATGKRTLRNLRTSFAGENRRSTQCLACRSARAGKSANFAACKRSG